MIIWSSYVILVLGLGAAVGLILLEIRLASFDKPWVGLLPLVLLVGSCYPVKSGGNHGIWR